MGIAKILRLNRRCQNYHSPSPQGRSQRTLRCGMIETQGPVPETLNAVELTDALAVVDALRLLTPNTLRCSTLSIAGDKEGKMGMSFLT